MTSSKQISNCIQAVAFDMDGLMFNTEDLYDDVGEILLQRRGQRFDRSLKLQMMGRPGDEAFGIMKQQCRLDDTVEQLREETRKIFSELLPARIEMMPGLSSLLEWLEGLGVRKCVATSSHRQFANEALGCFDLGKRFDFVLTADDVNRGKPDPEVYLKAASRFNVSVEQLLVLEDSVIGSTAAANAGALTIAVPTDHSVGCDFSHVRYMATSLADPIIRQTLSEGRCVPPLIDFEDSK